MEKIFRGLFPKAIVTELTPLNNTLTLDFAIVTQTNIVNTGTTGEHKR